LRDEPHGTREETGLEETDEKASHAQASKGVGKTREGHNETPASDEDSDIGAGLGEFGEEHVARYFAQYVGDEEDHQSDVVVVAGHVEILLKAPAESVSS
jgi:hypothetical protein